MTMKSVDSLIEAAERDPALADALMTAGSLNELVRIGAERGHPFTRDEVEESLRAAASGDLDDDALDAVSGGTEPVCYLKYKLSRAFISNSMRS